MLIFEKFEVWRKGMEFAELTYKRSAKFLLDEKFGLVSQLRRAVLSISANVLEGNGRASRKDFTRFVEVVFGSLMETASHMRLSHRLTIVTEKDLDFLRASAEELTRMLNELNASWEKQTCGNFLLTLFPTLSSLV